MFCGIGAMLDAVGPGSGKAATRPRLGETLVVAGTGSREAVTLLGAGVSVVAFGIAGGNRSVEIDDPKIGVWSCDFGDGAGPSALDGAVVSGPGRGGGVGCVLPDVASATISGAPGAACSNRDLKSPALAITMIALATRPMRARTMSLAAGSNWPHT
jgi:hypothetical protein